MVDDAGVAHSSACFRWLDLLRGPAGRARQSRRAAWGRTKEAPTAFCPGVAACGILRAGRSEEHTSELQSLMRISYAVFCLKKKNIQNNTNPRTYNTTN